MKTKSHQVAFLFAYCTVACLTAPAATLHVWQESPSSGSPYSDWATAAHTIQDALDAAQPGDLVLVTNGVYASGGKAVGTNVLVNRVAVDKAITLQSVNGPQATIIEGAQAPGGGNGDGAIRCVSLTDGAVLSGFTLTKGGTRAVYDYPTFVESGGGGVWCPSTNAIVTNCSLTGNSAGNFGGGAIQGTLNDCTLAQNSAPFGGGASKSTLNHCRLIDNTAYASGGAVYAGTLNACVLSGNAAQYAGGTFDSVLNNCTLSANSAVWGGGALYGTLKNCTLTGNSATSSGGGAGVSPSTSEGWGLTTLENCVVFFNTAPVGANYGCKSLMDYSCTTPLPTNGFGNITNAPAFVNQADGDFRLRYGSPCIDTGTDLSDIITNDFDGYPRPLDGNGDGIATFDMGAYECVPLLRYVWQGSPSPSPPYTHWATAAHTIQEAVDTASAGDLVLVTNGIYASGGRAVSGLMTNRVAVDKPLTLASISGPGFTVIQGYQLPGTNNGHGAIRCVYLANGAVLSGFTLTNGATLGSGNFTDMQSGGGVWCESTNALVTNCVLAGNSAGGGGGAFQGTLRNCSVSGNWATVHGGGAILSTLTRCTLTGNSARRGGGADFCRANLCTLTDNWAELDGGGAMDGWLNNCTLAWNSARHGGGAWDSELNNCTLAANWAEYDGGGACYGELNNCIIYYNDAARGPNCYGDTPDPITLNHCCTTDGDTGTMTNEPMFLDLAAGNLRLQSNSPCINAGNNSYVTTTTDLDGHPRIVSGTVDMGAYEYQGTGSAISYAWLQQYGLLTDGSADLTDSDRDGLNTSQEWTADTDPTSAASCLRLTISPNTSPVTVTLSSSVARLYTLLCCSNLTASSIWTSVPGQTDVSGSGAVLTLSDTNPPAPAFYRVSVRFP